MKIIKNTLSEKMITILKKSIGKRLLSFSYDYHFDDKNTANSNGVEFNFDNKKIILYSDLKYFDILSGDDYSYLAICEEEDEIFSKLNSYPKKEKIAINQIIQDIQIVTDNYHLINEEQNIDEYFISDYAIIFIFDDYKICFEKFDIYEDDLEISKTSLSKDFSFFDNSEDFENPDCYKTERNRTIKSIKE